MNIINDSEDLETMEKCKAYLDEKYNKEFEILYFIPFDMFNSRSKLGFKDGDSQVYFVYVDESIGELQDDYFPVNIGNRYDEWLIGKVREEGNTSIERVETRFSGLFGKEFTGCEDVESLIAMKNDLTRDVDVYIDAEDKADEVKVFIEKLNEKYELKGFYRIIKDNRELAFVRCYDNDGFLV